MGRNFLINRIKTFITDHKKDLCYIFLLTIFLLLITIPKLLAQYNIGIGNWDTYLYLENGRNFAKMGWGDVPSISPVLPMILSKMFLIAGHPYQEAIFNIDVFFYILGVVAFYLLLRLKYGQETSLVGSVIYATFTLLYSWVAIGGNDIIGITGTILTVYLIFISHRYNNKFYFLALPIAAYAFLSRYTAGVMVFSIAFYWIIRKVDLKEILHIIVGGILGVISVGWFLYQFYIHLDTPFPFLGQFSGTVSNTVVMDSGFLPDSWYYIKHIPNYLCSSVPNIDNFNAIVNPMGNIPSLLSYVYIILFILGFVLLAYNILKTVKSSDNKISHTQKISLLIALGLFVTFLFTLGNVSYIISTVLFLIVLYILWKVLEVYDIEYLDFDFVMISLFVVYLVFQSILFTKNDRYFITVLPFIAYFITFALDAIYKRIDDISLVKSIKSSRIISVLFIIFLLVNTLSFVSALPTHNDYHDIEEACSWLSENENVTNTTVLYSDDWPAVSWYMNIYCQRGVPNTKNKSYPVDFAREILSRNKTHWAASYFIDCTNPNKTDYPGMNKYKTFNTVEIYKNKYLESYGFEYIHTSEYNDQLQKEINEFNRTMSG